MRIVRTPPGAPFYPSSGAMQREVLYNRVHSSRLAWEVLERIHPTISVGANELQRDLIARLALGLPRSR